MPQICYRHARAAAPSPLQRLQAAQPFSVAPRALPRGLTRWRSEKYFDDIYEYRHVVLPPDIAKMLPKARLLSETEWRGMGVQQSRGWVHYAIHRPEPHIMLFRRPLNYAAPAPLGDSNRQ